MAAAYHGLLSGAQQSTTLQRFANTLVGQAKVAFLAAVPPTIESTAVFDLNLPEIHRRISRYVITLVNGIQVTFPTDTSVDPQDFVHDKEGVLYLRLDEAVQTTRYD